MKRHPENQPPQPQPPHQPSPRTRPASSDEILLRVPSSSSADRRSRTSTSSEYPRIPTTIEEIDEDARARRAAAPRTRKTSAAASSVGSGRSAGSHRKEKVYKLDGEVKLSTLSPTHATKANGSAAGGISIPASSIPVGGAVPVGVGSIPVGGLGPGGQVNLGFNGSAADSVNSLAVIREQYCSCTRWSRLEKTLVIIVSILAMMVIILVITVGLLADGKPHSEPRRLINFIR